MLATMTFGWSLPGRIASEYVFQQCALFSKVQSVLLLDFQVKAKSIINKIDPTLVEETLKF